MPPVAYSAAEQPLQPAEESTALAGDGRRRCWRRVARRRLGSRRRSGDGRRLARRRGRFRRLGNAIHPRTGPGCLLHLFVVTTQNGICRRRSGDLLHLLVMPAQNGICRYCAHSRLLVESAPTIVTKMSLLSPETLDGPGPFRSREIHPRESASGRKWGRMSLGAASINCTSALGIDFGMVLLMCVDTSKCEIGMRTDRLISVRSRDWRDWCDSREHFRHAGTRRIDRRAFHVMAVARLPARMLHEIPAMNCPPKWINLSTSAQ